VGVIRAILILIALGLIGGGVYFIFDRPPGGGIDYFIPTAMMWFFAILMFTVFVPMVSRLNHGKLLATGEQATATIVDVRDTGTTVNERPAFKFTLDVRNPDGTTTRTTTHQIVERTSLGALRPGLEVPVRVDPKRRTKVAIDSGASMGGPTMAGWPAAPTAMFGGQTAMPGQYGAMPTGAGVAQPPGRTLRAPDVIRNGVQTTATIQSAMLTGQTVGQMHPAHAEPHSKDDPMVFMTMSVMAADGSNFTAQGIHRVPGHRLQLLSPGTTLPVAYLPADPVNSTCVNWDRL
jgi:hypothetical protein